MAVIGRVDNDKKLKLFYNQEKVCDIEMDNLIDKGFQPTHGLAFITYGHYGSTYFDPMNGDYLEICICDVCLASLSDKTYKGITK